MIKVVGSTSSEELITSVRGVSLLTSPEVKPYEAAIIEIKEIDLSEIRPTTLYVLRQNLAFQRSLSSTLREVGFDPLDLDGSLTLSGDNGNVGLIPPLVEIDPQYGPCLADGAHRVYVGQQAGRKVIRAICIEGANPDYPLYAYPNNWDEIAEYDEVPKLKKYYREGNPAELYRNISSLNGSALRTNQ